MVTLPPSSLLPAADSTLDAVRALRRRVPSSPEVCVAVLDGPVDLTHACFRGADLRHIDTLVQERAGIGKMSAHGTHVASVLFGQPFSGTLGLADRSRGLLLPVFRDNSGYLSQLDLARAIERAVLEGAHIVNISGGERVPRGDPDPILARALNLCDESGVLVVAATGNDGCDCLHVPAAVPSVLAVGAMDRGGAPIPSSNFGDAYRENGVLAAGEDIPGAVPGGGIAPKTGSSFATPIASGVAALLMSMQLRTTGSVDAHAVREAIVDSAIPCPVPCEPHCARYLAGTLNVSGAYERIQTGGRTSVSEFESSPAFAADGTPVQSEGASHAAGVMPSAAPSGGAPAPGGSDSSDHAAAERGGAEPARAAPEPAAGPSFASGGVAPPAPQPPTTAHLAAALGQAPGEAAMGAPPAFQAAPLHGASATGPQVGALQPGAVPEPGRPVAPSGVALGPQPGGLQPSAIAGAPQPGGPPPGAVAHATTSGGPYPGAVVSSGAAPSCGCGGGALVSSGGGALLSGGDTMPPVPAATGGTGPGPGVPVDVATGVTPLPVNRIFAIGNIGFDFGSEARRDTFRQLMPRPVTEGSPPVFMAPNPYDVTQLADYLDNNPFESTKIIWTLDLDLTTMYAIVADPSYAEYVYQRLRLALRNQALPADNPDFVSRVSIPGVLTTRTVRLFSGQVVPVVVAQPRGLYIWSEFALVEAVVNAVFEGVSPPPSDEERQRVRLKVRQMLDKVYYQLRNLGQSPPDRAINFQATNAFVFTEAIARGLLSGDVVDGTSTNLYTLDSISASKSPYCRPDSDCWDVQVTFFDSENDKRARVVFQSTIDVSDELPVQLAPTHQFLFAA